MATIRKNIDVTAPAAEVWDVIRDVGAVHTRFAPGFVVDTVLEDGARVVKFANGVSVRELIVGIDDDLRRLAYAATGGIAQHHNASFEVIALSADRTRIVWTTDVLPEAAAKTAGAMIEAGSAAIVQTLNRLGR
jgi:hypothetical protein